MRTLKLKAYTTPIFLGACLSLASLPAISQSTSDDQIKTVISEGIGTDVPSALQNAAQNALTNVVGSFVDATKLLEKRVEIQEGIRSETSSIDTNIKEYSQGSIKGVELIDASEQSGLVKVTAKISVRGEAFKAYINKIAAGEQEFSGEGLFAQAATEKKQSENKQALLDDLIKKVIQGIQFNIGKPSAIGSDKINKCSNYDVRHPFAVLKYSRLINKIVSEHGKENVYVFEAHSFFSKDLINETKNTLSKIAIQKSGVIRHNFIELDDRSDRYYADDVIISILNENQVNEIGFAGTKSKFYLIKKADLGIYKNNVGGKNIFNIANNKTLNLSVEILDDKDNILEKEIINPSNDNNKVIAVHCNGVSLDGTISEWYNLNFLALESASDYKAPAVIINEIKPFDIIMAIAPDVVAKARKIRINLTDEI